MGLGHEASSLGGLLANSHWYADLQIRRNSPLLGITIASFVLGATASSPFSAMLCDSIGRRTTVLCACLLGIAVFIGQAFVPTVRVYLALRLLGGFASGMTVTSSVVLMSEISPASYRAQITALYPAFFYVGSLTSAWIALVALRIPSSWSWRLPILLQAMWPVVQFALCWQGPESPRWLMTKERPADARDVLRRYCMPGTSSDFEVDEELEKLASSISIAKSASASSWTFFFKRANIRVTVLIVFLGIATQCVGNAVINFYLAPVLATVGINGNQKQSGINVGLQIFSMITAFVGASIANKFGRRQLLLTSTLGMLFALSSVTLSSAIFVQRGTTGAAVAVVVFLYLFNGAYNIGFATVPNILATELVTTQMRAKTLCLMDMVTGVTLTLNQFLNPVLLKCLGWKYFLVYIGFILIDLAVIYVLVPDTRDTTLNAVDSASTSWKIVAHPSEEPPKSGA